MKHKSTKVVDGFSTCFRQFSADGTPCKFLHGYALSFKLIFECKTLDSRNWVQDFGFLKREKYNDPSTNIHGLTYDEVFKKLFDHTTIVSIMDPQLKEFQKLDELGAIKLHTMYAVGCECFAEYVFELLDKSIDENSDGRVKLMSVECIENSKNSAIYER